MIKPQLRVKWCDFFFVNWMTQVTLEDFTERINQFRNAK